MKKRVPVYCEEKKECLLEDYKEDLPVAEEYVPQAEVIYNIGDKINGGKGKVVDIDENGMLWIFDNKYSETYKASKTGKRIETGEKPKMSLRIVTDKRVINNNNTVNILEENLSVHKHRMMTQLMFGIM